VATKEPRKGRPAATGRELLRLVNHFPLRKNALDNLVSLNQFLESDLIWILIYNVTKTNQLYFFFL